MKTILLLHNYPDLYTFCEKYISMHFSIDVYIEIYADTQPPPPHPYFSSTIPLSLSIT